MTPVNQEGSDISRMRAQNKVVEQAMREAAKEAVLAHKRLGLPIVVWRDGQVVWVPADELDFSDESQQP